MSSTFYNRQPCLKQGEHDDRETSLCVSVLCNSMPAQLNVFFPAVLIEENDTLCVSGKVCVQGAK